MNQLYSFSASPGESRPSQPLRKIPSHDTSPSPFTQTAVCNSAASTFNGNQFDKYKFSKADMTNTDTNTKNRYMTITDLQCNVYNVPSSPLPLPLRLQYGQFFHQLIYIFQVIFSKIIFQVILAEISLQIFINSVAEHSSSSICRLMTKSEAFPFLSFALLSCNNDKEIQISKLRFFSPNIIHFCNSHKEIQILRLNI